MTKYKLEYIWLDGYTPTPNLRGKTQIKEFASFPTLEQVARELDDRIAALFLPNADGAQPPLFSQKNYYNPLTVAVTTNNANLVENPHY